MLYSLFIFKGKVLKAKREDSKFNRFIFLEDIFAINSPQKYKAGKAFKKSPKKKLKIGLLASSGANRQKGKAVIITEADKEEIIKKPQLKWKMKYLYYFKTLVKLIETLNSKKELKSGISSLL